jgi:hypothetical protein
VAGARIRGRVIRDGAHGTLLERTRRVAGVRPPRDMTLGRAASARRRRRLLGARQPRITLLLAGSAEQVDWEPIDRAVSEPPIPRPAAGQSRQPGGEPEWSRPGITAEVLPPPVETEPFPDLFLVACMVVAAGLIAGILAYVVRRQDASTPGGGGMPPSAPAQTVSVQQAERWIRTNVAANTPVCGDRAMVTQLSQAGFTAVTSCQSNGSLNNDRFVVSTPDIRAAVAGGLAVVVRQRASLPVAVFGTGAERVEVLMIVPGAQAALSTRLTRDLHERALAAAALLHNPRVTATASARAALRRGQLDMRAATLLALLTARTPVRIDTITSRPPEEAAGRPARSVTLSVADPAALAATTHMLTGDYTPALVTTASGSTRLDWPVGLAPNAGLG